MSRNIPRHLRQKHHPQVGRIISHDISVMVLRTGAILVWCGCLVSIGFVAFNLFQNARAGSGSAPMQSAAILVASALALFVGLRLWALKRWAAVVTLIAAWVFSLGEPWRPLHYNGGIVDVSAAIGASVMISAIVAVPLTVACWVERSRLKAGI